MNRVKAINSQTSLLIATCLVLSLISSSNSGLASENPNSFCAQKNRIESAQQIIDSSRSYQKQASILIAQVEKTTAEAKRLEGNARSYESKFAPKLRKLSGPQLAQAKLIFSADLKQFAKHAQEYREHTKEVRAQFGQCHASQDAFERNKLGYDLHCGQYHMQNVEPPHICPAMRAVVGEAAATQNQLLSNITRMNQAEQNLKDTEDRVKKAVAATAQGDTDIAKQNTLNLKEQELASEYGTLKEEYRQLEVGRKALQANGAKIPVATVKGTITHEK